MEIFKALHRGATVVLLDEPTAVLVTHELGFAYHFANKVVFLADGLLHESGTPDEVLKHPKQALTQRFLERFTAFHF